MYEYIYFKFIILVVKLLQEYQHLYDDDLFQIHTPKRAEQVKSQILEMDYFALS